jgi:ankyrin repeat protein
MNRTLEAIKILVDRSAGAVQMANILGYTPLHYAYRYSSMQVVQYLAPQHPPAAQLNTIDGETPLHILCDRGPTSPVVTVDFVTLVIKLYPKALTSTTSDGFTPLYKALRNRSSQQVIQLLLDRDSSGEPMPMWTHCSAYCLRGQRTNGDT